MLSAGGDVVYIHEPFSLSSRASPCYPRFTKWFTYITRENESEYRARLQRLVELRYPLRDDLRARGTPLGVLGASRAAVRYAWARAQGKRPLIKDPIALMSAQWLADTFGTRIVVLIRHPCAFIASLKRMNWRFSFANFTSQPLLMRDLLGPFERQMHELESKEHDLVENGCLLWNIIHHAIAVYRERRADWHFVRYEDLATQPLSGFQELYEGLGLDWNLAARTAVERHCYAVQPTPDQGQVHRLVRKSSDDAWAWRKLMGANEVDRVRRRVDALAGKFYSEESWATV